MSLYAAIMYGQGDDAVDIALTAGGIDRLAGRVRALPGVTCDVMHWNEAGLIATKIKMLPDDTRVVIGGTSLGANESPYAASLCGRAVDFMFGIQPSIYGRKNLVPGNVRSAWYCYQPWGLAVGIGFGYGSYQWELAPGNRITKIQSAYSFVSHPGSNDEKTQVTILDRIKLLLGTA